MSITNLGIQEYTPVNEALQEVFPGCPEIDRGYAYLSARPGLGVDIDEARAAKYPVKGDLPEWTNARLPDGSAARP